SRSVSVSSSCTRTQPCTTIMPPLRRARHAGRRTWRRHKSAAPPAPGRLGSKRLRVANGVDCRPMTGADKPVLPPLEGLPGEEELARPAKGVEAIREAWKRLPSRPGVYRMLGSDDEVLYVGKAKRLKNRVGQYAHGRGHTNAVIRMLHQTARVEVIVTATETEALLLETNLIKRLKPRFNVLMR